MTRFEPAARWQMHGERIAAVVYFPATTLSSMVSTGYGDLSDPARLELVASVWWALYVCRFMNLTNARIVEHHPNRAARRQHERTGARLPTVYRTIEIDPMGSRKQADTVGVSGLREPQRWHKVRGHFKNYTDWWGIGKRTPPGEYWFSEHFAGDPARGVAIHDYKLAAPHV